MGTTGQRSDLRGSLSCLCPSCLAYIHSSAPGDSNLPLVPDAPTGSRIVCVLKFTTRASHTTTNFLACHPHGSH
ncbi:hypothetical protein BDM02DRAFT_3120736 [Thelephora ganbajun]|uniref:Uncharacterized protein n=1 Tax=Thelephora ganbajun TaxID=370292 RepID=A0ACB6Z708_THEGA|nr:hypothetical protein BDM02DRAFT_3120736 [Thelephora ganbajun]